MASIDIVKELICYPGVFKLVVVSNGDPGWLQSSLKVLLPDLNQLIDSSKIDVISSRERYADYFPNDPGKWKDECFADIIEEAIQHLDEVEISAKNRIIRSKPHKGEEKLPIDAFYDNTIVNDTSIISHKDNDDNDDDHDDDAKVTDGGKSRKRIRPVHVPCSDDFKTLIPFSTLRQERNKDRPYISPHPKYNWTDARFDDDSPAVRCKPLLVCSVGDGLHEREALINKSIQMGVYGVSIKLLETPHPQLLTSQITYLTSCIDTILSSAVTISKYHNNILDLEVFCTSDHNGNKDDENFTINYFGQYLTTSCKQQQQQQLHVQYPNFLCDVYKTAIKETCDEPNIESEQQQLQSSTPPSRYNFGYFDNEFDKNSRHSNISRINQEVSSNDVPVRKCEQVQHKKDYDYFDFS